ncbi:MAG: DUF4190 domain-containing protein [Phycisphaerales bacterium JB059]
MTEAWNPYQAPQDRTPPEPRPVSNLAITAFVLSLPSLCLFPFALVSLPMGIVGITRTGPTAPRGGRGLAIAATSISAVGLLLSCVQTALFLPALAMPRLQAIHEANLDRDMAQIETITADLRALAEANEGRLPGPGVNWERVLILNGTPASAFVSNVDPDAPFLRYVPAERLTSVTGEVLLYTDPALYRDGSGFVAYHDGFVERVGARRFGTITRSITSPDGEPRSP